MKRIDQQIRVTELVAKSVDLREVKKMYPKLAVYMMRNISIMLSISSIHLLLIKTEEAFQKRKRMWEQVKDYDRILYYRLRCSTLSGLTYLPGRLGENHSRRLPHGKKNLSVPVIRKKYRGIKIWHRFILHL